MTHGPGQVYIPRMQVTFSADDPLDRVVAAVEAVYGVRLKVKQGHGRQQGRDDDHDEPDPDAWDPAGGKVRQDKS